jgi:hypothetical protein
MVRPIMRCYGSSQGQVVDGFSLRQVDADFGAVLRDILKRDLQYKNRRGACLHLRHTPSAFLVLVGLFGIEWFVRRRAGLA